MELPTVSITKVDLQQLRDMTRKGTHKAREITRAEILLLARERMKEDIIARHVRRHVRTVRRVVARFRESGLDRALFDAPRSGQPKKTSARDDAHLIAIACTDAPEGHAAWTLELLRDRLLKDRGKCLATRSIWLRLKASDLKPWREKNVVHSKSHAGIH